MSLINLLLDLVYVALLIFSLPLLTWRMVRHGKYQHGLRAKLWGDVPPVPTGQTTVWMHGVSVGEIEVLRPLIAELKRRRPDVTVVVSSTTRTGYALARHRFPELTVFYCPLDVSWAVRRALRRLRPTLLVLVELELWPNLIRLAKSHGAFVTVVNGRLSESSYRGYRRGGPLIRYLMRQVDAVGAQDDVYGQRFAALGVPEDRLWITGSMKFDGAESDRANPGTTELARLARFLPGDVVFLAGSTQEPEERLAVQAFRRLSERHPCLRLILVPRHPERFDQVAQYLASTGLEWQRRSQLAAHVPHPAARILLVDTVGELGSWWGTAEIGLVGGSLGSRGGQNMIEPSAFGVAVCFGPHTENFRDVVNLLQRADACRVVHDGAELEGFVGHCLDDPSFRRQLGDRARNVVAAQRGATRRTADILSRLVGPPLAGPHFPLEAGRVSTRDRKQLAR